MQSTLQNDSVLGPLRLKRQLGTGAFGVVWLAHHSVMGRDVAAKILFPRYSADPKFVLGATRELDALKRVEGCPGVTRVHWAGMLEGHLTIVMDFVPGKSLAERIRELNTFEQRMEVLRQLAATLDCVHGKGLVHRDLKPSNVLISEGGDVFLVDFGLAKVIDSSLGATTSSHDLSGSAPYRAPDGDSGTVTSRADLYSFAVIAHEMLVGQKPFEKKSVAEYQSAHRVEPVRDPRSLNIHVQPQVAAALMRGLAKKPSERFASAKDMVTALSSPGSIRKVPDWLKVAASIVVFLLLVGLAGLVVFRPAAAPGPTPTAVEPARAAQPLTSTLQATLRSPVASPPPPTSAPVPPSPTPVPPTSTPIPPTNTPRPTDTPVPPTATPLPPTMTPTPAPRAGNVAVVLGIEFSVVAASYSAKGTNNEPTYDIVIQALNKTSADVTWEVCNGDGDLYCRLTDAAGVQHVNTRITVGESWSKQRWVTFPAQVRTRFTISFSGPLAKSPQTLQLLEIGLTDDSRKKQNARLTNIVAVGQ